MTTIDDLLRLVAETTPPDGGVFGFRPEYLKISPKTKDLFPENVDPSLADRLFGVRVVIDQWIPDGFIAVVGPPVHGSLGEMPQVVFINVTEGGSLDLP